jgi:hypothetical protein
MGPKEDPKIKGRGYAGMYRLGVPVDPITTPYPALAPISRRRDRGLGFFFADRCARRCIGYRLT